MFLWHVGLHTIKMNGRWWKMSAGGVATCRITLSPTPNTGPLQESHIPLGSLDIGSKSYWYIVTRHSSFNLCGWLRAFCDHNNMCSRLPSVCSCFSGSCISAGGKPSNWLPSTFNFCSWLEGKGIYSMWMDTPTWQHTRVAEYQVTATSVYYGTRPTLPVALIQITYNERVTDND